MSDHGFEAIYRYGAPPWDLGHAQPAIVQLAEQGQFQGRVLDVGCGTGDNALHLASLGLDVTGIDASATAIRQAQDKVRTRHLFAKFLVADAFALAGLGQRFDAALDCSFLHIPAHSPADRRRYTNALADVLEPTGWAHFLELSRPDTGHPAISQEELRESLDPARWTNIAIHPASLANRNGQLPAWLAHAQRR